MYPKNAASPEPIAIGPVVQISDGAVQTSGVTVRIKPIGVAEADGVGTVAYSTDGIVIYTPTQAETNYTSFVLVAKKASCIPASITVITTASATPGTVLLAPVTHTSAVVPTVGTVSGAVASVTAAVTVGTNNDKTGYSLTATTGLGNQTANITGNLSGSVGSVTGAVGSVTGAVGSVTAGVIVTTNNDKTGYTLTVTPPTAAAIADAVWDEAIAGHANAGSTGAALSSAGNAGDPWSASLPASYTAGTAGYIVGTFLDSKSSTIQQGVNAIGNASPGVAF